MKYQVKKKLMEENNDENCEETYINYEEYLNENMLNKYYKPGKQGSFRKERRNILS